jgi:hypothetical protein
MNFLEKYNTDDVFFRGIILGLLTELNQIITYEQIQKIYFYYTNFCNIIFHKAINY